MDLSRQFQFWENARLEGSQTILVWIEASSDSDFVIETPDQDGLVTWSAATLTVWNLFKNQNCWISPEPVDKTGAAS